MGMVSWLLNHDHPLYSALIGGQGSISVLGGLLFLHLDESTGTRLVLNLAGRTYDRERTRLFLERKNRASVSASTWGGTF